MSIEKPIKTKGDVTMGQYWKIINLDKKEYIENYNVGTGAKFAEHLGMHPGANEALMILLVAMPERRGGGDIIDTEKYPIVGRWAGDRITMIGDYANDGDISECNPQFQGDVPVPESEIWESINEEGIWYDVSDQVAEVIEEYFGGQYVGEGWKQWEKGE